MRVIVAAVLGVSVLALAACGPQGAPPAPAGSATAAALAPPATGPEAKAETQKLIAFLDKEFEKDLELNPERATSLGMKIHYDQLNDISEAQSDKMLAFRTQSVADMKKAFDRAKLDADGQMYFDIYALELARAEKMQTFKRQALVFGRSAPHSDKASFLISFHRVDNADDAKAYISRLTQLGRVMDQATERAKAAAGDKIRMPKFQYERVIAESTKLITGAPFGAGADSPLWADVKKKFGALKVPAKEKAELLDAAKKAMIEGMKPGYDHVIAWAKEDMANAPSGKVGAVTLPDGVNWYAAALYDQTTTTMTAEQIHELGVKEVARIHGEMDKLAQTAGFKDRANYLEARGKRKDVWLPPTDAGRKEYLKIANAEVAKARSKIGNFFGELPKYNMVVEREPVYSEIPGGAAHASRATPDGSKPGKVYVHMLNKAGWRKAAIPSLMCHEAVPGHLLQGDIMVRQSGAPKFRTSGGYAAFSEGWGLYSEALCKEMGIYEDVDSDYERLEAELWRAVRLVLDTGLHAKGWSEDEAVKYALENTSRDEEGSRAEVRRFIINPGQATAYKIGMIRIQQLRAEAEKELGDKFDIKGFHDRLISAGSLPLEVADTRMRLWIAEQKAK